MSRARIVICASGEGTNFTAIVQASRQGRLAADVVGLITNRATAGALDRARRWAVPERVLNPREFTSSVDWDRAMVDQMLEWRADWVVLAGFLLRIGPQVLTTYPGRVINSHPSLLPKYGGQGMYGRRVHEAVLGAREIETGITIHLVDAHYDQGRVLHQERIPVRSGESVDELVERVKRVENDLYPKVLNQLILNGS